MGFMGKNPTNLIGSFYASLSCDTRNFCISANYPETTLDSIAEGFNWILRRHALDPLFALSDLPAIGKAIEKAVISRSRLELPAGIPIDRTGSTLLPEPFLDLFLDIFHGDGTPRQDFDGSTQPVSYMLLR